jgi:hypothetical protein
LSRLVALAAALAAHGQYDTALKIEGEALQPATRLRRNDAPLRTPLKT